MIKLKRGGQMKDLLYIKYPEITDIKANIVNRKYDEDKTYLLLDRTIFSPTNSYLYKDVGEVSSLELLDVFESKGKLVHKIQGKPQKNEVKLSLNKDIRYHNLYYNTAYLILQLIFKNFYNIEETKLKLYESHGQIIIEDFFLDFDKNQLEEFANHLIRIGLNIKNLGQSKEIGSLGRINNQAISFLSTADIFGIHIYRHNLIENTLILDFVTGKDFLDFNQKNLDLIKKIEKLATSEDIASNKITKIITEIKNHKY